MDLPSFRLLAVDTYSHNILISHGPSGEILKEIPYPAGFTPTELTVNKQRDKAYIPGINKDGSGGLLIAGLTNGYMYQAPLCLPQPTQFALSPDNNRAYFSDKNGHLYQLNLLTLALRDWGGSEKACCVGLSAEETVVYSVWEHGGKGSLAIFTSNGQLLYEHLLPGIPTNITIDHQGYILIPITSSDEIGEGIVSLQKQADAANLPVIVKARYCMYTRNVSDSLAYPSCIAVSPDEDIMYVVNEEKASITVIDLTNSTLLRQIFLKQPISCLHLLPNSKWAVASSHLQSALSLIDLVKGETVCVTDTPRELMGFIAVLP